MPAAEDFLTAAETLAGSSQPGLGHFRRAISTAYYAAFHCVVEASVEVLFASQVARDESRKWFEHGRMADVAQAVRDAPTDPKKVQEWITNGAAGIGLTSEPSKELRTFGQQMRGLYDQRQLADYFSTPALALGKGDALRSIANARSVCQQVGVWTAARDVGFERVSFAMLSRSVGAKKR